MFNSGKVVAGSLLAVKMGYDIGKNLYFLNKKNKTFKYCDELLKNKQYDHMITICYRDQEHRKQIDRQIEATVKHEFLMLEYSPHKEDIEFADSLKNNKEKYYEWKRQIIEREQEKFCNEVIMPGYRNKYNVDEAHKYNISLPNTLLRLSFAITGLDIVKDGIQHIVR